LYCESAQLCEQRRKVNLKTSRSKSRRHANLKKNAAVGQENDTTREKGKNSRWTSATVAVVICT
jgi:hypothetical protein